MLLLETSDSEAASRWRFLLTASDGGGELVASEIEHDVHGQRLELLAVIRGLEALDQPSRVTLLTSSKYVRHGLMTGLARWRENNWHWERFGELVPVRNCDLWQRLDQALIYHDVECRRWRFDMPQSSQTHVVEPEHDQPALSDAPNCIPAPKFLAARRRRQARGRTVRRQSLAAIA